jgi:hypothetical protein
MMFREDQKGTTVLIHGRLWIVRTTKTVSISPAGEGGLTEDGVREAAEAKEALRWFLKNQGAFDLEGL